MKNMKDQKLIIKRALPESIIAWEKGEAVPSETDVATAYFSEKRLWKIAEDICENLYLMGYSVEPQDNSKQ